MKGERLYQVDKINKVALSVRMELRLFSVYMANY